MVGRPGRVRGGVYAGEVEHLQVHDDHSGPVQKDLANRS
jgi:hypothetical protein